MQELIEHEDHESSEEKLDNDQNDVEETKISNWTVHSGENVSKGFTKGDKKCEQLGCGLIKLSVFLGLHVDIDNLGTHEELQDHAGGNDWGHTKFHDGTLVGGKDNSEPVQWVGSFFLLDTIQWDLTADQIDE